MELIAGQIIGGCIAVFLVKTLYNLILRKTVKRLAPEKMRVIAYLMAWATATAIYSMGAPEAPPLQGFIIYGIATLIDISIEILKEKKTKKSQLS